METHSKLRAFQIYFYANLDPRDVWKCAQFVNGVAFLRSAFNGCITFPPLTAPPPPPHPPRPLTPQHRFSSLTLRPSLTVFYYFFLSTETLKWQPPRFGQFLPRISSLPL